MRTLAVAVLLGLGTLFAFIANASVWANRTIFDTDTFVSTAVDLYEAPEVKNALATRITERIVIEGDVQGRLQERLPDGLDPLAAPLAESAYDLIYRTTLSALESDEFTAVLENALRVVHTEALAIIEDDSAVEVEGDAIILNLGEIVAAVLEELGVNDPEGFLYGLELPPDSGKIVLFEDAGTAQFISDLASLHNVVTLTVVLVAVAFFAAAIILAKRLGRTFMTAALLLLMVGLAALLALVPVRGIAIRLTEDQDAAAAVFDVLLEGYRKQSLLLVAISLVLLVVLFFVGSSPMAKAVRRPNQPPGLRTAVVNAAPWLRAGGLVLAAAALLVPSDPTTRFYWGVLACLALYLFAITVITSDASWAARVRHWADRGFRIVGGPERPEGNWLARHTAVLRLGGVGVAILALLFWPEPSVQSVVAVIALLLIYLAVLDFVTGRAQSEPEAAEAGPDATPPALDSPASTEARH